VIETHLLCGKIKTCPLSFKNKMIAKQGASTLFPILQKVFLLSLDLENTALFKVLSQVV
jgi:hypothetical protein